jgi:hypothetical protein
VTFNAPVVAFAMNGITLTANRWRQQRADRRQVRLRLKFRRNSMVKGDHIFNSRIPGLTTQTADDAANS